MKKKTKKSPAALTDDKLLRNNATKIKKWIETVHELESSDCRFALSITKLTSIKSLCQDEIASGNFGLFMAKIVQQLAANKSCPDNFTQEEWETNKNLIAEAITAMENYLENPTHDKKESLWTFLKRISELQGDNFQKVHWTTIHFVKSGDLLKIEYAIRCIYDRDFPYYAYKLAREYTELYEPSYGTGLLPASAPKLLEIAEFWCQYYFGLSLAEKFPKLMNVENQDTHPLNSKRNMYEFQSKPYE